MIIEMFRGNILLLHRTVDVFEVIAVPIQRDSDVDGVIYIDFLRLVLRRNRKSPFGCTLEQALAIYSKKN